MLIKDRIGLDRYARIRSVVSCWVVSQMGSMAVMRPRPGYRDAMPVDEDEQILQFEDEE